MGNLFVMVGAAYAVVMFVQVLCYMQSVKKGKKGKTVSERVTVEAGLMTPQNV